MPGKGVLRLDNGPDQLQKHHTRPGRVSVLEIVVHLSFVLTALIPSSRAANSYG